MGGLVVIIFWIIMIAVFAAKGKKKQGTTVPNKAPQKMAPAAPVKNAQNISKHDRSRLQNTARTSKSTQKTVGYGRNAAGNRQSTAKYSRMGANNAQNDGRKSRTMHPKNTGKYGQNLSDPDEDILVRANRNTEQHFSEDVLEQRQKNIPKSGAEQQRMPVEEDMDLMKEVFDLMITGPDTSTYYGRDFVAEGVEMVNRSLESF